MASTKGEPLEGPDHVCTELGGCPVEHTQKLTKEQGAGMDGGGGDSQVRNSPERAALSQAETHR